MKIAIVHDDLIQFGGAEEVLLAMCEIWPKAPVYTAYASKKWQKICLEKGIELRTSFMQKLPFIEKIYRYYAPFMLHVLAFESFDFSGFDVVLSSSARFSHGVITKATTKHICYMNSPGRMFWEAKDYFEGETYGFLKAIKFLAQPFLKIPLSHLRLWDFTAAQRIDHVIANSETARKKIKKYHGRDSEIIYPFVNCQDFSRVTPSEGNYFLVITRLVSWKRVDIAVKACSHLGVKLKVAGKGPEKEKLERLAGPTVEILGYVEEKKDLLANCRAVIVTQREDFGIVPLEAMASGRPVIAYGAGGVLETVVPKETGEFFNDQTWESLEGVLKGFDPKKYSKKLCRLRAEKFDKAVFKKQLKDFVKSVCT